MMGGPIDTREAPTAVNTRRDPAAAQLVRAERHRDRARSIYPGAGRKVYPGFLQLAGFMSMNLGNHLMSHYEMFQHLVAGRRRERGRDQGVLRGISLGLRHDRRILPADDRRRVPGAHAAQGRADCTAAARSIPAAITDTAMLAIEGERDDISGIGQTKAALTIATSLPDDEEALSTWPRRSAITASSTAAAGARRSRRCWRSGSRGMTR